MDDSNSHSKDALSRYQKIRLLGEGSFGKVFLYRKIKQKSKNVFNDFFYGNEKEDTAEYFALKKYHPQYTNNLEGMDFSSLRQINLLIACNHKNVASCHEIIYKKSQKNQQNNHSSHHNIYVVLDFHLELGEILTKSKIIKNDMDKKSICLQILHGLAFLHSNFIFHRDLKPENIFVSKQGDIKLSDFGFAKQFGSPHAKYTANTCTKQYRAPQLFFGTHYYTQKCDIWSFGCIIAYIFTNKTIFFSSNESDIQILARIFQLRGTPNRENWLNYDKFPDFVRFQETPQKDIKQQLQVSTDVAKIIQDCLQLSPSKRPSVNELLQHQFWKGVQCKPLDIKDYFTSKIKQIQESFKNPNKIEEQFDDI